MTRRTLTSLTLVLVLALVSVLTELVINAMAAGPPDNAALIHVLQR